MRNLKKITHFSLFYHSGSLSVVPGPKTSASPGNLLKIQITGPAADPPTKSKTLGWGGGGRHSNLCLNKPSTLKSQKPSSTKQKGKSTSVNGIRDGGHLGFFFNSCPNLQSQGSIYPSVQWGYGVSPRSRGCWNLRGTWLPSTSLYGYLARSQLPILTSSLPPYSDW